MTHDDLRELITMLGKSHETTLDPMLAAACRAFLGPAPGHKDPVRFLRNLGDICMNDCASSGFTMYVISAFLRDYPETAEEERVRQVALHADKANWSRV